MDRIQEAIQAAEAVYGDTILADLAATQAVLEAGLLQKKISSLASDHYNYFGIKGEGTVGTVYLWTWEHIKGKNIKVKAGFAKNATVVDSFAQHQRLLNKSRYRSVREAKTFEEAARAVKASGYATDPNYAAKLIDIYNKYILPRK